MKRTKSPRFLNALLLAYALLSLWACNVREPGCLDIEAENFDVAAERHDASLCTYPDLLLSVQYQWADSNLQIGRLYHNAHGMNYAIHGVQILFSNFLLMHSDGEMYTIDERVDLPIGSCASITPLEVPDDFLFVDRTTFLYSIGDFRKSGLMSGAMLTLGVPESDTPVCIDSLPANHLLKASRAGYDPLLGDFALGRFVVSVDSISAERDTFYAYGPAEKLQFDVNRTFRQGKSDTLYMTVDFHQIFDPVDLSLANELIAGELAARIRPAISIR